MDDVANLVIVSDLHCGCQLGLCPPDGARLDDGGRYQPSPFQLKLWELWNIFWDDFVPSVVKKEPYSICLNGDAREGIHHQATTPISHNEEDQEEIAYRVLLPLVERSKGRYFQIRGTEAHVGKSAIAEERLAKRLKLTPNEDGQYSRYELWKRVGPKLVHCLHHVGTVNSQAYETTALHKELIEAFVEAARWNRERPDAIARSHRHRHIMTEIATLDNEGKPSRAYGIATPAWQGKTPHAWKVAGARNTTPQFGGVIIRYSKGEFFVRDMIWTAARSQVE